jgi:hypothetical protein
MIANGDTCLRATEKTLTPCPLSPTNKPISNYGSSETLAGFLHAAHNPDIMQASLRISARGSVSRSDRGSA